MLKLALLVLAAHPEYFRKGYGIFMMQRIEESFPEVKIFTLDTPIWNIRTNAFYQKLGYMEVRSNGDFVYYEKLRGEPIIL